MRRAVWAFCGAPTGHEAADDALQPIATATSVRVRNGETVLTDGPFAETKEQLGGYHLVEAADLDEATAIARTRRAHDGQRADRPGAVEGVRLGRGVRLAAVARRRHPQAHTALAADPDLRAARATRRHPLGQRGAAAVFAEPEHDGLPGAGELDRALQRAQRLERRAVGAVVAAPIEHKQVAVFALVKAITVLGLAAADQRHEAAEQQRRAALSETSGAVGHVGRLVPEERPQIRQGTAR